MNYWLLCVCNAFASFAIVLAATHLLIASMRARLPLQRARARSQARVTFVLRILPAVGAAFVTFALVLPAFFKLEPHSTEERLSLVLLLLACVGGSLCAFGL